MNTDFIIPGKAEELAASFDDQAQELLINYTMLSDEAKVLYIVTLSDMPMKFSRDEDGTPHALWVSLREATRFSNQREADITARNIRNGNGDKGRVVTLGAAHLNAVNHLRDMAHELRASAEVRKA